MRMSCVALAAISPPARTTLLDGVLRAPERTARYVLVRRASEASRAAGVFWLLRRKHAVRRRESRRPVQKVIARLSPASTSSSFSGADVEIM